MNRSFSAPFTLQSFHRRFCQVAGQTRVRGRGGREGGIQSLRKIRSIGQRVLCGSLFLPPSRETLKAPFRACLGRAFFPTACTPVHCTLPPSSLPPSVPSTHLGFGLDSKGKARDRRENVHFGLNDLKRSNQCRWPRRGGITVVFCSLAYRKVSRKEDERREEQRREGAYLIHANRIVLVLVLGFGLCCESEAASQAKRPGTIGRGTRTEDGHCTVGVPRVSWP